MSFAASLLVAAVIAYVIVLNIWDHERRRGMTPEERKAEDDALDYGQ